jgi:Protein of unknown function (DUF3185)
MKRTDARLLAGLILFVIGAAVFAYGIITYTNDKASLGGSVERIFVGSSSLEQQSIIEMIAGGAIALIGFILLLTRRRAAR